MDLVLFDLDNTLLSGDSDHQWGQYMCEIGAASPEYKINNQKFYDDYCKEALDIYAYLQFALRPLAENDMQQLIAWRASFIDTVIVPMISAPARDLVSQHQSKGDLIAVISSTNQFLVEPIAQLFGISEVIATQAEVIDNRFSGKVKGTPCFGKEKLVCLKEWLATRQPNYQHSWFYSDSINDLPTLEWVDKPIVVNGDDKLLKVARQHNWQTLSF